MSKPPLSDDIRRAFLIGAKYGFRRARRETRRDVECLMDELHEANDQVHALLAVVRSERPTDGTENDGKHDPETQFKS